MLVSEAASSSGGEDFATFGQLVQERGGGVQLTGWDDQAERPISKFGLDLVHQTCKMLSFANIF